MECNKEEAIRAKGMAESKMQNKDFPAARKLALKAQQLYKDLGNISQILVVCDVHCSAEKKLFGNEMDWYGILQIERTADEATIRKQYRKFALQLHPDKNKFPGAEAAFKLLGEALRVLSDREKRSLYDIKCRASVSKPAPRYQPQQRTTYSSNFAFQSNIRSNFSGFSSQFPQFQQSAAQPAYSNVRPTFWTACPFCNVKYQYYIEVKNKSIFCQNCNKSFIAYERSMQGASMAANLNQPPFPQKKEVPNQHACKVELKSQGNFSAEHSRTELSQKKGHGSECGEAKVNGKRRRKQEESSESCDSQSSAATEEDMVIDEDGDFKATMNSGHNGEHLRRSDRHKQQVSYKENLSDDEDFVYLKKAKGSQSCFATEEGSENGLKQDVSKTGKQATDKTDQDGVKREESPGSLPIEMKERRTPEENMEANDGQKSYEISVDALVNPEVYEYPDPDFNDFDKNRNEECFSAGQIWAVYDTLDAMPRFYAQIRKVFSPGFKLRITWLEADPDDKDGIEWVKADLPVACGKFKYGSSENTEDRLMFSHLACWEKRSRRDTYVIFPRKGETWALFKNWDVKWKSNADADQKYEYEFVEVLADYNESVGTCVAVLGKVKGFVSLFCRISREGKDTVKIPPGELLRFSHMVPSFKLVGVERKGVPKESLELDPASLPKNIEEIVVSADIGPKVGNTHHNDACSTSSDNVKPEVVSKANTAMLQDDNVNVIKDQNAPPASTPEAIEIPDPEFFNFDAEKSSEKFQVGQIWSLYSDEEGLPKYYGQITEIHFDEGFQVHLRWLIPYRLSRDMALWRDKAMPVCCGKFKVQKGTSRSYTATNIFSHQLTAEPTGKENEYAIFPRKGEVWALYRNWSTEIKVADLENCQYDVVEVLERTSSRIRVSFLERVSGFNSVFRPLVEAGLAVTMDVSSSELIRFSHQIPAFRLTEERCGHLRGFWELDPAALPVHYFAMN